MNTLRSRGYVLLARSTQRYQQHQRLLHHGCRRTVTAASNFRQQIGTVARFVPRSSTPVSSCGGGGGVRRGRVRGVSSGALPADTMYLPMPKLSPSMVRRIYVVLEVQRHARRTQQCRSAVDGIEHDSGLPVRRNYAVGGLIVASSSAVGCCVDLARRRPLNWTIPFACPKPNDMV